ncbi:eCIS core domain-containing protein [Nonomuraea longicatena]|uniref:eCIS core domain-containing protein n=1 Tax=Nonomuraea longicatena TaxID=83682 RepID=A0ABN1PR79_9ACTN
MPQGSAPATRPALSGRPAHGGELRRPGHDLRRRAERAARRVEAVLGTPVRPDVRVAASAADAARAIGAASVDGLAAVAHDGRVIVVPETYGRLTPTGRDVVLAHELTHVAAGTDGLPPWLYEGFADYVAYRDAGLAVPEAAAELAEEVRAGRLPENLPEPADFAPGAPRLAQSYQEAWLACRLIAHAYGEATLVRLYRDAQRVGAGRALPVPVAELTRDWRAYLGEELA